MHAWYTTKIEHIWFCYIDIYLEMCGNGRLAGGGGTLSSVLLPKHRSVAGSSHGAMVPLCKGEIWVRGFSRSARRSLLKLEYPEAV